MSFLLHILIKYYTSLDSAALRRPYRFSYLVRYRIIYIFERLSARCAFEKHFYKSILLVASGRRLVL